MDKITAPYGFVPLNREIVFPEWIQPVGDKMPPLHDVPFEDGLCGTLQLEVACETPLFTRGVSDPSKPFQLDGGRYAIPGTALRGALRNVMEIATFGRFQRVNDHRYAIRDLQNRMLYGQYMADIVKDQQGKGLPMPLVNAGWLRRATDANGKSAYFIDVCDFVKIEYRQVTDLASQRGIRNYTPGRKQTSVDKYNTWGSASLQVTVAARWQRPDRVGNRRLLSRYGTAAGTGDETGTLVFTGQPSNWRPDPMGKRFGAGNAKHHDFVFFDRVGATPIPVPRKTYSDFVFAHSDRGQQNNLGKSQTPNEEWGHWKKHLDNGGRVPIFFLTDDSGTELRAFGLAMMFRLSYKHSIGQAVDHVNKLHRDLEAAYDFAEGLFGTVRDDKAAITHDPDEEEALPERERHGGRALKGRVGISHAIAVGNPTPMRAVSVILGAPKASYYPNYVEQDQEKPGSPPPTPGGRGAAYVTWMDEAGVPRGWKRYRTMTETWNPKPPTGSDGRTLDLSKVGTTFEPLPAGTRFTSHIDVHNLRPMELGALLWVLDFGKAPQARHSLGMARPLGYGRVKFTVTDSDLRTMTDEPVDLEACRAAFEQYMNSQIPNWKRSAQIVELTALAYPVPPNAARYQRLDPGARVNEFVDAKKRGMALPSVSGARYPRTGSRPGTPAAGAQPHPQQMGQRPGQPHQPARPGSAPPQGSPAPRSTPPPSISSASAQWRSKDGPARWTGKSHGDVVEVKLTGMSRKGKWRCTVVGYPDTSGAIDGQPPTNAAEGQTHSVSIVSGTDPANLALKWVNP